MAGIAETIGAQDQLIDFTVALDKLDKIGFDGVVQELEGKGFSKASIAKIQPLMELSGTATERLSQLKVYLAKSSIGQEGLQELSYV